MRWFYPNQSPDDLRLLAERIRAGKGLPAVRVSPDGEEFISIYLGSAFSCAFADLLDAEADRVAAEALEATP